MKRLLLTVLFIIAATAAYAQEKVIDLSGSWRFAMDPDNVGEQQAWFGSALPGESMIRLPGSMQEQGFGDDPGMDTPWIGVLREKEWAKPKYAPYRTEENFKMPFWLQPDKYFRGSAWYQKTVVIPDDWKGESIFLKLERPHIETRLWVDSQPAGSADYLSVEHTYDLSRLLTPGRHVITIRVNNQLLLNVGLNSHSVSDHTQSNWNGIVGKLELRAVAATRIDNIQVYPDLEKNGIKVTAEIINPFGKVRDGELLLDVRHKGKKVASITLPVNGGNAGKNIEREILFGEKAETWDEFNPELYTLQARLKTEDGEHQVERVFGMREIVVEDGLIMLNGRRAFMRGTLECCIFPRTGYPPTDVESWKRIIKVCKAHGLNHIRFHSWCPPEAAFIAADEMGFYYQVECSTWPKAGTGLGENRPIDKWLYKEADAVLKAYGNHPSFLLFASGNEPGGRGCREYLKKWVTHYKAEDSRRLVTSGAGGPIIPVNDYHCAHDEARIQHWRYSPMENRINARPPETVTDYSPLVEEHPNHPIIVHENGQWCVYPNFEEMKKYTGVLKPRNFEIFRDFLEQKDLLDQAYDFLMASGKLQVLCYKEEIESNLRTQNYGGFQLLDLHDFPGQGTALIGILDPFWDSKPYVSPEEFRRFCAPIVPLARLSRRTFVSSDRLKARIDVSQFGEHDMKDTKIRWALLDGKRKVIRKGVLTKESLPAGDLHTAGHVEVDLSSLAAPAKYSLEVSVEGSNAVNDWDVWVYPDNVDTEPGPVHISSELDDETLRILRSGGKVLLVASPSRVKTDVQIGFSSIFWNTAWTKGKPPHTLGILCDPEHPALAAFPTEYHSNWQWSVPIQNAATMELDHLSKELKPIIQVVPDWFEPKKLALAFEANVCGGSLIVCSVDLISDIQNRIEIRQLRSSLLDYMESDAFHPQIELSADQIRSLIIETSEPSNKRNRCGSN